MYKRQEYRDAVEYAAAKRLTEALEEAYDFVIPDDEVIYYLSLIHIWIISTPTTGAIPLNNTTGR